MTSRDTIEHGLGALDRRALIGLALVGLMPGVPRAADEPVVPDRSTHGLAMHGEPALPADFEYARYVNPDAPQGGRLTQGVLGTFDSLNPFIVRGLSLSQIRGYVVESLLARHYDEPFSLYGLLARSVATNDQRTQVTFELHEEARFSDGVPVTAVDVVFSWELLRDHGRPNYRTYYAKVSAATVLNERSVRFDLTDAKDRELPLILGLMPVLARHATPIERFEETSLMPMLGSGPYMVSHVEAGRSILLKRNAKYWGQNLPINRGLWNFEEVRFDFYRDSHSHMEAFAKGLYDVRVELDPGRWETAYDIPAVRDGRIIKDTFTNGLPKQLLALVFNTRRSVFKDVRVREALGLLFDFEWLNRNFFYGDYQRTGSYFEDSELSARGRPASQLERELLSPFPDAVRADILDGTWHPPVSDGSGRSRETLRRALTLFDQAGYVLDGAALRDRRTGRPFSFEMLTTTRDQERLALAYARDLKRAGIQLRIRVVDAVQFDQRRLTYDFDMIENRWDQSLSPGNEQLFYWSAAAATTEGTRNYMGAQNPAIDRLINVMLEARDRESFVAATRALDRVLMSGFYVIPLYHLPRQWVARWAAIKHPDATSLFGYLPETWWREPTP